MIRIARPAMATAIGFAIGGAAIPQGERAWAIGAIVGAGALGGTALALSTRDVPGALPLALAGAAGMATTIGLAFVMAFAYEGASTLAPWYLIAGLAPASVGTWLGVAKGEMRAALTLAAVGTVATAALMAAGVAGLFGHAAEGDPAVLAISLGLSGAVLGAAAGIWRHTKAMSIRVSLRIALVVGGAALTLAALGTGLTGSAVVVVVRVALPAVVVGVLLGLAGNSWRRGLLAALPATLLLGLAMAFEAALADPIGDPPVGLLGGGARLVLLPLAGTLGGAAGARLRSAAGGEEPSKAPPRP